MLIHDPALCERYYQALLNRSPEYTGSFFAAVHTTGIFCVATCRARKPKAENVSFYSTLKSALDAGFRPCKICKPGTVQADTPVVVQTALQLLQAQPDHRVNDQQLRQAGISPETLRRWFLRHHGMTFQAYQRSIRINAAMNELQAGNNVIDVAMNNGYNSISGFNYTVKKLTGRSATQASLMKPIVIKRFDSPLGPLFVCATENGVCLLEFVDRRMLETEFGDLQRLLKRTILPGENTHTKQAEAELAEYFSGQRQHFSLTLDLPGSAFQQRVWQALQAIPYGQCASYQQQAVKIGQPNAVRAVARANGFNRVAIVVPCHRVIGKDGSLTGYGGGLERKRWLLNHERQHS